MNKFIKAFNDIATMVDVGKWSKIIAGLILYAFVFFAWGRYFG